MTVMMMRMTHSKAQQGDNYKWIYHFSKYASWLVSCSDVILKDFEVHMHSVFPALRLNVNNNDYISQLVFRVLIFSNQPVFW